MAVRRYFILAFIFCLLAACSLPTALLPTPTPSPANPLPAATTAGASQPSPTPETQKVISVRMGLSGSAQTIPDVTAGNTVKLEAAFEPVVQVITHRADGSVLSSSTTSWQDAPVTQMRYCLSSDPQPCDLGKLQPFQAAVSQEITVEWLGPHDFTLIVEFADAAGQFIPSVPAYAYNAQPQTRLTLTMRSSLPEGTPLAQLPPPVQTAAAATQTAYPVTGSVQIEGGRCCAGGSAGDTVRLQVDFQAESRAGKVTEMKVQAGQCVQDAGAIQGNWEPFQAQRTFQTTLALNWVGWWISVQYRDAAGNLSPVYCDDISLEGSPPTPTP